MTADIMHRAFGITNQECLEMLCESNKIMLKIQTPCEKNPVSTLWK